MLRIISQLFRDKTKGRRWVTYQPEDKKPTEWSEIVKRHQEREKAKEEKLEREFQERLKYAK
jgi:hypothetical protein